VEAGTEMTTDHRIFDREIACCRPALYPAALEMTGNPCDAEDLVQETMTRAWTGLQNYTPGTSARAWLRRIMANTFANACRKQHREVAQVLRPELEASASAGEYSSATQSAEEVVLAQLAHSEAGKAVSELPECFRAVVYLSDAEGYAIADIAELTGVPNGTVQSRLHRGRSRLRTRLADGARSKCPDSRCGRIRALGQMPARPVSKLAASAIGRVPRSSLSAPTVSQLVR
jgi:RNA polymerase sigma-70 factor, ECF subfamily